MRLQVYTRYMVRGGRPAVKGGQTMRPAWMRLLPLAVLGMVCLASQARERTAPPRKLPEQKKSKDNDNDGFVYLGDLTAEVAVLQVMRSLQPTPAQEKA